MASPPEGLSTHECGPLFPGELKQLLNSLFEFFALQVICIRSKRSILPSCVL